MRTMWMHLQAESGPGPVGVRVRVSAASLSDARHWHHVRIIMIIMILTRTEAVSAWSLAGREPRRLPAADRRNRRHLALSLSSFLQVIQVCSCWAQAIRIMIATWLLVHIAVTDRRRVAESVAVTVVAGRSARLTRSRLRIFKFQLKGRVTRVMSWRRTCGCIRIH